MRYKARLEGVSPLICHNGAAGLDTRSPAKLEIAEISRKRGSNRTEADDDRIRELECQTSLYIGSDGAATLPESMFRACIEKAARKLKQGPQVREGLIVDSLELIYDRKRYGSDIETLGKNAQFTTGVVVQRNRILRTRAMFESWAVDLVVEVDPELVDAGQLGNWLEIAGRRVGVGDWRPEKSGHYGRFDIGALEVID